MIYLSNAFSLQMIELDRIQDIRITPLTISGVKATIGLDFISAVGHSDTATVLTDVLGVNVPANRINISVTANDTLIVAQLIGGRLPEGSKILPEGFEFKFVKIELIS